MEKVRLYIKKRDTERKEDDAIDLDEKIRRIREKNKARERRHKEIENDKLQASFDSIETIRDTGYHEKERSLENILEKPVMKCVQVATEKKIPKGRGQRLLEMSKEPLKAMEFASKTRKHQKMHDESVLLEGSKISSNANLYERKGKSRKIECDTNQRNLNETKEMFNTSEIPSVGFNPLMDDRYIDKPKKVRSNAKEYIKDKELSRRCGSPSVWDKVENEVKGQKRGDWERPTGHGRKDYNSISYWEVRSSSRPSVKQTVGQGDCFTFKAKQLMSGEDWSTEVIGLDESKTKLIADNRPGLSEKLQEQIQTGHLCGEEKKKDTRVSEDSDAKENGTFVDNGLHTKLILGKIPKVCQLLEDQLSVSKVKSKGDEESEKVHDNNIAREEKVLITESQESKVVTNKPKLQQDTCNLNRHEESSSTKDHEPKVNTEKPENEPNIIVNSSMKKTPSNSSFDDVMSMLSPLDVPLNWGDCEFNDDNCEPVFYPG